PTVARGRLALTPAWVWLGVRSDEPSVSASSSGAGPTGPVSSAPASSTAGSPTIPYHARDVVMLHAQDRHTTMIVLQDGEDIIEATCGDKEFWIVNARGAVAYIKPAKPASDTNLNLVTTTGQVYAFRLTEISTIKDVEPDLAVYLEPDDPVSS